MHVVIRIHCRSEGGMREVTVFLVDGKESERDVE